MDSVARANVSKLITGFNKGNKDPLTINNLIEIMYPTYYKDMVHNNTLPIFKQNFRVLFESIKTIDNIYVCQLPIFKYYVDNYPYIKFIHQTGKGLLFDLSIKTSKSYRGDV
jgi:hypothetical protein